MAKGTHDSAVTTNEFVKEFVRDLPARIEEEDPFSMFFKPQQKPDGIEKTMNFVVDATADSADRQAPLARRISHKRSGYEVEITVGDKLRYAEAISWELARKSRFDEIASAAARVPNALLKSRATVLGDVILGGAMTNASPTNPSVPANGETAAWWNANDTKAPASYGGNAFAAGGAHRHIETGITAMDINRIRVWRNHITEHGFGKQGFVGLLQNQENSTLLNLANVAQNNVTSGVKLRDDMQRAGLASEVNGYMGVEWIVSQWPPAGTVGFVDRNLAGLPGGGAIKLVELDTVFNVQQDEDIQGTWVEGFEQYGAGAREKAAGYAARVA